MTFNPNVPNAGQSPQLFPPQNAANFAQLQKIIEADHVFNETAQTTDGFHKQVRFLARGIPASPEGSNGLLYVFLDPSGQAELRYRNNLADYPLTPADSFVGGTVTILAGGGFANIVAVPANVFGRIYLWKGRFIQAGTFVSDLTVVNGYSYAEKYISGTSASQILNLGFDGDGANGLTLTVKNTGSTSFDGAWKYQIFYRNYV